MPPAKRRAWPEIKEADYQASRLLDARRPGEASGRRPELVRVMHQLVSHCGLSPQMAACYFQPDLAVLIGAIFPRDQGQG